MSGHESGDAGMAAWWETIRTLVQTFAVPPGFPSPGAHDSADPQAAFAAFAPALDALEPSAKLFETFMGAFNPLAGAAPPPGLDGLERSFGALTDAAGLGPTKALHDACRDLGAAEAERRKAQAAYLALVGDAWANAGIAFGKRLGELAARDESPDTVLAWTRLWTRVAEQQLHRALQSEAGLAVTARFLRASLRMHERRNVLVAIASEALNVPTRAEVDEAYREIQGLKREMRVLRREVRGLRESAKRAGDDHE